MKGIKQRLKQTFASPDASQFVESQREGAMGNTYNTKDTYKFIDVEESGSGYATLHCGTQQGPDTTEQFGSQQHKTQCETTSNNRSLLMSRTQRDLSSRQQQQEPFMQIAKSMKKLLNTTPGVQGNDSRLNLEDAIAIKPSHQNHRSDPPSQNPKQSRQKTEENLKQSLMKQLQQITKKTKTTNELPFTTSALGFLLQRPNLVDEEHLREKNFKLKSTSQPNSAKSLLTKGSQAGNPKIHLTKLEGEKKESQQKKLPRSRLHPSARNQLQKIFTEQRSEGQANRNSSQPSQGSQSSQGVVSASKQLLGLLTYRTASNQKLLAANLATTATGIGLSSRVQTSGKQVGKKAGALQQNSQVVVGRFSAASRGCVSSKTDSQNHRGGSIPSASTDREGSCAISRKHTAGHQRSLSHTAADHKQATRVLSPTHFALGQTKQSLAGSLLETGHTHLIIERLKQRMRGGPSFDASSGARQVPKNLPLTDRRSRIQSQTAVGEYLRGGSGLRSRIDQKRGRRMPSPLQTTQRENSTQSERNKGFSSGLRSKISNLEKKLQLDQGNSTSDEKLQTLSATQHLEMKPDEPTIFPVCPDFEEYGVIELDSDNPLTQYELPVEIDMDALFCTSFAAGGENFEAPDRIPAGTFTFFNEQQSKMNSGGLTFAGDQSPCKFDKFTPTNHAARVSSANKEVISLGKQCRILDEYKCYEQENRAGKLSEQKTGARNGAQQLNFGDLASCSRASRKPFFALENEAFEQQIQFSSRHESGCMIEDESSRDARNRDRDSVYAVDSLTSQESFHLEQNADPAEPESQNFRDPQIWVKNQYSEMSGNVLNSSKEISRFSSVMEDIRLEGELMDGYEILPSQPDELKNTLTAGCNTVNQLLDIRLQCLIPIVPSDRKLEIQKTPRGERSPQSLKSTRNNQKKRREDPAIHMDVCSNMVTKGFYLHNTHPDMTQIDDRDEFVTLDDNRDLKSMFGLRSQDFERMALKDIDRDFDDRESFIGNNKEASMSALRPPKSHRTLYGQKKSVNGDDVGMDLSPRMTLNSNAAGRGKLKDNGKKLYQSGLAIQLNPSSEYEMASRLNSEKASQKNKRHFAETTCFNSEIKPDLPDYEEGLGIQAPPPECLKLAPHQQPTAISDFSASKLQRIAVTSKKAQLQEFDAPDWPSTVLPVPQTDRTSVPDTFCLSSATKSPGGREFPDIRYTHTHAEDKLFPTGSKICFELDSEAGKKQQNTVEQRREQVSDFTLGDRNASQKGYKALDFKMGSGDLDFNVKTSQGLSVPFAFRLSRTAQSPGNKILNHRFNAMGKIKCSMESEEEKEKNLHFDSQSFVYRSEASKFQSADNKYSLRVSDSSDSVKRLHCEAELVDSLTSNQLNLEKEAQLVHMNCSRRNEVSQKIQFEACTAKFSKSKPIGHLHHSKRSLNHQHGDVRDSLVRGSSPALQSLLSRSEAVESQTTQKNVAMIQVPKLVGLASLGQLRAPQVVISGRLSGEQALSHRSTGGNPLMSNRTMSQQVFMSQTLSQTLHQLPEHAASPQQALRPASNMGKRSLHGSMSRLREIHAESHESPYLLQLGEATSRSGLVKTSSRSGLPGAFGEGPKTSRQTNRSRRHTYETPNVPEEVASKQRQFE